MWSVLYKGSQGEATRREATNNQNQETTLFILMTPDQTPNGSRENSLRPPLNRRPLRPLSGLALFLKSTFVQHAFDCLLQIHLEFFTSEKRILVLYTPQMPDVEWETFDIGSYYNNVLVQRVCHPNFIEDIRVTFSIKSDNKSALLNVFYNVSNDRICPENLISSSCFQPLIA